MSLKRVQYSCDKKCYRVRNGSDQYMVCPETLCCNETNTNGSSSGPSASCDKELMAKHEKIIDNLVLHGIKIRGLRSCPDSQKQYKELCVNKNINCCPSNIDKVFTWVSTRDKPHNLTSSENNKIRSLYQNNNMKGITVAWPFITKNKKI